ncbi:PKD domain-containing protein [Candidatus Acetothermia bacterium]|nr:PKD domain-containing protein [Candidatus Acetothermia bacterium]MBI3659800.1 PKD domain-containing protein [Candidatus Acetothermia bacterium]
MKRSLWLVVFLVVVGAALAGCGGQKPPSADISGPTEGQTLTAADLSFDGKALDDSKKEVTKDVTYEWDFGDGEKANTKSGTHTYKQGGDYTVTLTVKTAAQAKEAKPKLEAKQTKSVKVSVKLNQPPTVTSITATPASGPAPLEVTFESDAKDDSKIASYSWDFGDGSPPGTDEKPIHKYEKDGEYTVKLTVTDDAGATASASIAAPVKVEAAKAPGMTSMMSSQEVHMMTEGANNTFMPAELKIKVGTKVRFLNMSGAHSATAYADKVPAGVKPFDSGLMAVPYKAGAECTTANGCYEVEFTVAGTYEYKCLPHEALGMKGKITVEP